MIKSAYLFRFHERYFHYGREISEKVYNELKELQERTAKHAMELDKPIKGMDPMAFATSFRPHNSHY